MPRLPARSGVAVPVAADDIAVPVLPHATGGSPPAFAIYGPLDSDSQRVRPCHSASRIWSAMTWHRFLPPKYGECVHGPSVALDSPRECGPLQILNPTSVKFRTTIHKQVTHPSGDRHLIHTLDTHQFLTLSQTDALRQRCTHPTIKSTAR